MVIPGKKVVFTDGKNIFLYDVIQSSVKTLPTNYSGSITDITAVKLNNKLYVGFKGNGVTGYYTYDSSFNLNFSFIHSSNAYDIGNGNFLREMDYLKLVTGCC